MLLLANVLFSIGFICAASQDGPFKYDISREMNAQESNYRDQVKAELLSKFIQNTLELSSNDDPKLNLIESNSIIDKALVEPFTDKYGKKLSDPVDESNRMKRARKLTGSTESIPTTEESDEDESVNGFVRQLIPSLLPLPKDDESLESNSTKPKFEDEFEDIVSVSNIDGKGDKTNLTIHGGDGNRNGNNSTNSANAKDEDDRKKEENGKNEDNSAHANRTQPMCPVVNPNVNDKPITTSPAPSNVEVSTIRVDVKTRNELDATKPTASQPHYPPADRRDGEVICTDRTRGKNCSEYIISLYGDEMALYLKITSSLKADLIKASKAFVPTYSMNQLPFYVRRNIDTTATYVPKSAKMVTPMNKAAPKYFNAVKNYVKPTSTPAIRTGSTPMKRVSVNSQRRMLPTLPYYTTPKYMKERRIQVYPTQRSIPDPRSISRKPPQQSTPMRNMTPRSVIVQKKNLPTRTAMPNIPELTNQIRHKLKLLRNLTASKMGGKGKLQNRVKLNKPDPRLVAKHDNKITASNNRKQKARMSAVKRPVARQSDVQNMVVPPKQKYPEKYRQNPYQLRGKYGNVPKAKPKPKPDHLPGVISGLTKREGVTFFNYYPFKKSTSHKRMKRSAVGSKLKKPYNFFMFSF